MPSTKPSSNEPEKVPLGQFFTCELFEKRKTTFADLDQITIIE
jgi:hypothetical protein